MGSEGCVVEEKIAISPKSSKNSNSEHHQTLTSRTKGGLITMPFIIVNESFERVSSYGLMPNLIFYLMNGWMLQMGVSYCHFGLLFQMPCLFLGQSYLILTWVVSRSFLWVPLLVSLCLNRACVIRDSDRELKQDGSPLNSWSLCSVDKVEIVKSIVRLLPISTTGIMLLVVLSNGYTTLQAKTMDRHLTSNFEIPAGAFSIFQVVTITVWIALYDRALVLILGKYFGMPRGLGTKVRMGFGLLLPCVAMLVGSVVEWRRKKVAIDKGMEDQPNAVVDMSALWLAPQLVLLGLGEAFNSVAQMEFFYTHISKSMSSFAMAIYALEMAVAGLVSSLLVSLVDKISSRGENPSWLSTNLNKGHVNFYYLLLSFLCLSSFLYFLICSRAYEPPKTTVRELCVIT